MVKLMDILTEIIQEAVKNTTTPAVRLLLQKTDKVGKHSDNRRVKNTSKLSEKDFAELISTNLDIDPADIEKIPAPNEESGTFTVFKFPFKNGEARIVLAGEQRGEKEEIAQKTSLEGQIKAAIEASTNGSIKIIAGGEDYTIKVGNVEKVPGNLMADLAVDNTIYIQLKQNKYQQLSGFIKTRTKGIITPAAGKEMDLFVEEVKKRVGSEMEPGTGVKKEVIDFDLAKAALFGSTTPNFSIDKVQIICQGEVKLVSGPNNTYRIQGTSPVETLDYTTKQIPKKWQPFMIARYSQGHNQYGIKNCRFNFTIEEYYPGATTISVKKQEVGKV